jgi:hypothetical protein
LSQAEARCLAYMMDIESHTSVYLRDLLATPAAFDPDVTAFLSCWVYEELWHGEAFSRFLGEAAGSSPPTSNASRPARLTPHASRGTSGSGAAWAGADSSATSARCSVPR